MEIKSDSSSASSNNYSESYAKAQPIDNLNDFYKKKNDINSKYNLIDFYLSQGSYLGHINPFEVNFGSSD